RELADAYGAVRLNPDEWESALDVDPFDEGFQTRLEAAFWELTQRLLVLGTSVVLEWGFWARSERDEKREAARTLGAAVELRFLDAPYEELVRRSRLVTPPAASPSPRVTWSGIEASSSRRQPMSWPCMTRLCQTRAHPPA